MWAAWEEGKRRCMGIVRASGEEGDVMLCNKPPLQVVLQRASIGAAAL